MKLWQVQAEKTLCETLTHKQKEANSTSGSASSRPALHTEKHVLRAAPDEGLKKHCAAWASSASTSMPTSCAPREGN